MVRKSQKAVSKKSTPVPEKELVSEKVSKTSKSVTPVTEVTPVTTSEATNVVSENTVVAAVPSEPLLSEAFNDMLRQLVSLRSQITTISAQLRVLKSRSERDIKNAQKSSKKRSNANRKPSGFVKPALISTELALFLGKPEGVEMARTEVTREINTYIRAHNLQDPQNGRRILPDAKLRSLLKIKKNEELTYFNLQRYMSHHFPKKVVAAVAAESS